MIEFAVYFLIAPLFLGQEANHGVAEVEIVDRYVPQFATGFVRSWVEVRTSEKDGSEGSLFVTYPAEKISTIPFESKCTAEYHLEMIDGFVGNRHLSEPVNGRVLDRISCKYEVILNE